LNEKNLTGKKKMENKKGIMQTGVIVAIVAILVLTLAGGYLVYRKNTPSVEVGPDGVAVKTNGVNVKTGSDGVQVDMNGVKVDTNGANVDVQAQGTTGSGADEKSGSAGSQVNSVLIFDASGSMAGQAVGGTRIQIAKDAMTKYVDSLKDNVNLSVLAYGQRGDNTQAGKAVSCAGIDEIYYMGAVNASLIKSKINALTPNGWTPITDSLKKAEGILQKSPANAEKHILLLSDGQETCGGDPVAYACQLKAAGIKVDVIGLDVTGTEAKQLTDISKCGGGDYYSVGSANDLNVVVGNMGVKVNTGNVKVDISGGNTNVSTGNVNVNTSGSGTKVQAGGVKVDTTGGATKVKVPGTAVPSY